MRTAEGEVRRGRRRETILLVSMVAIFLLNAGVAWLSDSDPLGALAWGGMAVLMAVPLRWPLNGWPVTTLAWGVMLVCMVLVFRPGWVGAPTGVRSLYGGTYTLTVTIDESTSDRIDVGERQFRFELERDGPRLSKAPGQLSPVFGGTLDGRTFTGTLHEAEMIWLEGECFGYGQARGRAMGVLHGPEGDRTRDFTGTFELLID